MKKYCFLSIRPVTVGIADDDKYCATLCDGTKFLLRVSPIEQYESKKEEYDLLLKFENRLKENVEYVNKEYEKVKNIYEKDNSIEFKIFELNSFWVPKTVDFGTYENDNNVYTLLEWFDGYNVIDVLPTLSEYMQYDAGISAGKILLEMQRYFTKPPSDEWADTMNPIIDKYIEDYKACELSFENDDLIIDYINKNRFLLNNRPLCFSQVDFQIDKFICNLGDSVYLRLIDFKNVSYIDPYYSFTALVNSVPINHFFATGQIHSYFDGEPPNEFWRILSFYMAVYAINALPSALNEGVETIDIAFNRINDILHWYNNMQNIIPTWYYVPIPKTGYCGANCSKCITYLATQNNDFELIKRAKNFYKDVFKIDLPLDVIHCGGCRSKNKISLRIIDKFCHYDTCTNTKRVLSCLSCYEYPCYTVLKANKLHPNMDTNFLE